MHGAKSRAGLRSRARLRVPCGRTRRLSRLTWAMGTELRVGGGGKWSNGAWSTRGYRSFWYPPRRGCGCPFLPLVPRPLPTPSGAAWLARHGAPMVPATVPGGAGRGGGDGRGGGSVGRAGRREGGASAEVVPGLRDGAAVRSAGALRRGCAVPNRAALPVMRSAPSV